jgi:hypothetical protein
VAARLLRRIPCEISPATVGVCENDKSHSKPLDRKPIVPPKLGWQSLLKRDGEELERHYRNILEELGKKSGMLGAIFKKAEGARSLTLHL